MICCSLKNDTYYESQADVIEYLIKNENGDIIYSGRSIKSPKTHTNRINVTEKIRNYLFSDLGPGWESGSTEIVRQQENAFGVFVLLNGELLLEKYAFIYSFEADFDFAGKDKVISYPINGRLDPRMKYLISTYGQLEDFEMTFSGDTNLGWKESSTTIYFTANKEPIVASYSEWISNVVITVESTGSTYTGYFTFDYEENSNSVREGVIDFTFTGSIYGTTQTLTLSQVEAPVFFTTEVLTDGEIEILNYNSDRKISYKKNNEGWTEILEGIIQVEEGDVVKWKYNVNSGEYLHKQFILRSEVILYGDILSLEYGDDFSENDAANAVFRKNADARLFMKDTGGDIKSISGVIMPAKINQSSAFKGLFAGDFGYTDAQYLALPATALTADCYYKMFAGCSTLTTAPQLPATSLAENCYIGMFLGCTSLVNPPELPVTSLAEGCYASMFSGCVSLVNTPELPATSLAEGCYEGMFAHCTSLTTAPELPATALSKSCYRSMFEYCTSLVNPPELPATSLAEGCYATMFYDCTSLVNPPELPATVLPIPQESTGGPWGAGCYSSMFEGCSSMTTAPALPASSVTPACYESMFARCTSLVNPPAELPATDLSGATICYAFMFANCTSLVNAPALPATVLEAGCYEYMFSGCTSMTTAPDLLAEQGEYACYEAMFSGCTSLNYIKCLLEVSSPNYTYFWVAGVSYSGTFVKKTGVYWRPSSGISSIPNGWTVEEADS